MGRLFAEILAIGTEVTSGRILNSNARLLSQKLEQEGFEVRWHSAVPDIEPLMSQALRLATTRAHLVVTTGGLGPTTDDLTTDCVCRLFKRKKIRSPDGMMRIFELSKKVPRVMTPSDLKMAEIPSGATVFSNRNGMACGYGLRFKKSYLVVMPGVPHEMDRMFHEEVLPHLTKNIFRNKTASKGVTRKTFKVYGLAEAVVSKRVRALSFPERFPAMTVGFLLAYPEVHVLLTSEIKRDVDVASIDLRRVLSTSLIAEDDDDVLSLVQKHLCEKGETLAVAESCTGGLLAKQMTDHAGASQFFLGGVVAYANSVKENVLGVDATILKSKGAVSEACASSMAEGVQVKFSSTHAIAITGVAGPDGGSAEKPVGTVYFGLRTGAETHVEKRLFRGNRERIRQQATYEALLLLYCALR